MIAGSSSVAVNSIFFASASSEEFLFIQASIDCGFTLKRVRDMTRTYSQMHFIDKSSEQSSISFAVWVNS